MRQVAPVSSLRVIEAQLRPAAQFRTQGCQEGLGCLGNQFVWLGILSSRTLCPELRGREKQAKSAEKATPVRVMVHGSPPVQSLYGRESSYSSTGYSRAEPDIIALPGFLFEK